jgi:S-DNA-T family DNA segregation ATPase FtsK/SpoIIIE
MPSKWTLPSTTLLQPPEAHRIDQSYLTAVARDLGARLHSYRIGATVAPAAVQGALVHKFEVSPDVSQELGPIMARQMDLEAAYKGFRFCAMPGSGGKLGIEIAVPDSQRGTIAMREVVDSAAWAETDAALPLALGVTTGGDPVIVDLATCPHLLVAGATGSGKSVGINVMLTSLLLCNSPSELQLILIDPKMVELARYRGMPHLICPVITEIKEAVTRLQWAVEEMERRYLRFVDMDVEKFDEFIEVSHDKLPRIVIVIDEYADLTSVSKSEVEAIVVRLAQKARAAGIYLILATQRPSVDVITGVIKANFPSRIAYKVSQREDSKTIIGGPGAERLLGNGDSLCLIPKLSIELTRVHGAFVEKTDVRAICEFWKRQTAAFPQAEPQLPAAADPAQASKESTDDAANRAGEGPDQSDAPTRSSSAGPAANSSEPEQTASQSDELYKRAIAFAQQKHNVSVRQLQDEFRCNFGRAKRLFDRMKEEKLIKSGGPNNTHIYIGPS